MTIIAQPTILTVSSSKNTGGYMSDEQPEWITAKEAAVIMRCSGANVTYLCRKGIRIESRKFGHIWQVTKTSAIEYERTNRDPKWLYPEL